MPNWADILIKVGIIPGLLGWMIYVMTTGVTQATADTRTMVAQHLSQSALMQKQLEEQTVSLDILIQINKYNCRHNSHTLAERDECNEASKR